VRLAGWPGGRSSGRSWRRHGWMWWWTCSAGRWSCWARWWNGRLRWYACRWVATHRAHLAGICLYMCLGLGCVAPILVTTLRHNGLGQALSMLAFPGTRAPRREGHTAHTPELSPGLACTSIAGEPWNRRSVCSLRRRRSPCRRAAHGCGDDPSRAAGERLRRGAAVHAALLPRYRRHLPPTASYTRTNMGVCVCAPVVHRVIVYSPPRGAAAAAAAGARSDGPSGPLSDAGAGRRSGARPSRRRVQLAVPGEQQRRRRRRRRRRCRRRRRASHRRRPWQGGGGGESFLRVHWVAVPKASRARRANRRRRRPRRAAGRCSATSTRSGG
jgi:hypothetical protein